MVSRLSSLVLLSVFCLAPTLAFAGDSDPKDEESSAPEVKDRPRSSWVWVDPVEDLAPDAVASDHISKIIFINRCVGGCTITPGDNDARINTSSIATSSSVLSEFDQPIEVFNEVVDCVRDIYSPYNVQIVTEDPGSEMFHHEAILAGTPQEMGRPANNGGVAPAGCAPLNNVISFSFANGYIGRSVNEMCWTVAQESAHSFGLPNHVWSCLDPMTYNDGCGKKFFQNSNLQCAEVSASSGVFEQKPSCNCSGSTQNSHVELRTVFGDGTQPPPPTVSILLPNENDSVLDNFIVFWDAQDERLVDHSDLYINGTKHATIPGHEYSNRADNYDVMTPDLPDGYIDIEIKAYNGLGSEAVAATRVLKGSPCADNSSCFDFQECNAGRCEYPPATSNLGDACDIDFQCLEGICGDVGGSKTCSNTCNPSVGSACPDGQECTASNGGGFVCAAKSDSGGCCSVAGTKQDPLPWFGIGIFFFGMMILRRRRV